MHHPLVIFNLLDPCTKQYEYSEVHIDIKTIHSEEDDV